MSKLTIKKVEALMKGNITKALMVGTAVLAMTACTTMKEIEVRDTKAHPSWYSDCEQIGSEGFLFWKTDFAYSCGMGESKFEQASESQLEIQQFVNMSKLKSMLMNLLIQIEYTHMYGLKCR